MAGTGPKDPAALWRDMIVQWEQSMNAFATELMSSGEYSRDMNRVMNASMRMQKAMQDMLARYFDALNLPTKEDLKGIGERLLAMDDQLARLTTAVERLASDRDTGNQPAPRVARTRRFRGEEAPGS